MPPSLTWLFPMWNEEAAVGRAVTEAVAAGAALATAGRIGAYIVLAVDDGSTDRTPTTLTELAAMHPQLRVVTHATNRGLGAAIRTGLTAADTDLVLYTDTDLPADLAEVATALDLRDEANAEIVSAYRRSRRGDGVWRFVSSAAYNLLVRVLLGVRQRDVNFAFKLLDRPTVQALPLVSDGVFIDAEIVTRVLRNGGSVTQFATDYQPRVDGRSTLSSPGTALETFREMLVVRRLLRAEAP